MRPLQSTQHIDSLLSPTGDHQSPPKRPRPAGTASKPVAWASTGSDAANLALTTLAEQRPTAKPYRLTQLSNRRPDPVTFSRLEQREGVVLEVMPEEDVFRARLVDPRAVEPDEEVVVEMEQLSPYDLDLVAPGALFFWAIGYLTKASGRRQLTLRIDFRRLPAERAGYAERASKAAKTYMKEMKWS